MYPVRYEADYVEQQNRWITGFRLILAIPWFIVGSVYILAAYIVAFLAWFVILFTGRLGEGLFNPMRSASAYLTRAGAYFLLLTEDWPPFSLEEGAAAPAGQIPTEAASRREPQ